MVKMNDKKHLQIFEILFSFSNMLLQENMRFSSAAQQDAEHPRLKLTLEKTISDDPTPLNAPTIGGVRRSRTGTVGIPIRLRLDYWHIP